MAEITTLRASNYLSYRFPAIKQEIKQLKSHNNFAGILQAIVNYLKQLIVDGKIRMVSRLIKFVAIVFTHGNNYIKEIIENLFVRSLESMHKRCDVNQWHYVYQKLPAPFKIIYNQQYQHISIKIN
ncbi:hypothetical protein J5U18_11165 [Sphingobacteriaceae bacterium WQ 2009]|uniref:DUF7674 domain-containing protein n=1 Tax=Rhinopithecimicrobium faecis TaxID=2820698 RepID=A0A8T4HFJ6_9SPHI|nr:hypothetical protein [Sphingobacteriaceae bacterium WQ 2009]